MISKLILCEISVFQARRGRRTKRLETRVVLQRTQSIFAIAKIDCVENLFVKPDVGVAEKMKLSPYG